MKTQLSKALSPGKSHWQECPTQWGSLQRRMVLLQLPTAPPRNPLPLLAVLPVPAGESKTVIKVWILSLFNFYSIYVLFIFKILNAKWNIEHGHRTSKFWATDFIPCLLGTTVNRNLLPQFHNWNSKVVIYSIFLTGLFRVTALDLIRSLFGSLKLPAIRTIKYKERQVWHE